jgi:hypothetical protein
VDADPGCSAVGGVDGDASDEAGAGAALPDMPCASGDRRPGISGDVLS